MILWRIRGFGLALPLIEQALYAGSNFVLQIFVAQQNSANAFGAYTIATAIFFLVAICHQTFLIEPVFVFGDGRFSKHTEGYQLHIIRNWTIKFGVLVAIVFTICSGLTWLYGSHQISKCLLAYAFAAPSLLHLWLYRRLMLRRRRSDLAVLSITLYLGITLLLLGSLFLLKISTAEMVVAVSGAGAWITSFVMQNFGVREIGPRNAAAPAQMWAAHYRYGRWSFVSEGVNWAITNIPLLILPLYASLSSVATVRVVSLIFMPLLQIVGVLMMVMLRDLASQRAEVHRRRRANQMRALLLILSAAYALISAWLSPHLTHVLGPSYRVEGWVVVAAGVGVIFLAGSQVSFALLRVFELPRAVFNLNFLALFLMFATWMILQSSHILTIFIAQAVAWAGCFCAGLWIVRRCFNERAID